MTAALENEAGPMKLMDTESRTTPEFIAGAVDAVRKRKPAFGHMLDLYEKIFIEQENSKTGIRHVEFSIPDEALSVIRKEKFPLVDVSRFIVDEEAAGKLFSGICAILLEGGEGIAETARVMMDAANSGSLDTKKLFQDFITDADSTLGRMEKDLHAVREVARFIIFNSMKPSLSVFSRAVSSHLDTEIQWDKGFCPVCGSMPELSVIGENGKRSMLCGFCGHQWLTKRVFCPFCGNDDHGTLEYYEIEGEEEYRVDVCGKCRGYIKAVDTRKLSRPVYLPLETVATPYIDMKFGEMGYRAGSAATDN